jgi:uncharacterized protein
MLRIPTFLAPSTIPGAGIGLFTRAPVGKGTILWQFDPGLDRELLELPDDPQLRRWVLVYGYVPHDDPKRWVLCMDDARFFNHSDTPNCTDTDDFTRAGRDLAAGEELTSDYRAFCREPFAGFEHAGEVIRAAAQ